MLTTEDIGDDKVFLGSIAKITMNKNLVAPELFKDVVERMKEDSYNHGKRYPHLFQYDLGIPIKVERPVKKTYENNKEKGKGKGKGWDSSGATKGRAKGGAGSSWDAGGRGGGGGWRSRTY